MSFGHAPYVLPSWREGVLPVRVLSPNPPIRSVNDQLRALVSGNASRNTDGLFLRYSTHSSTSIAFAFNLPSASWMCSNMLGLFHITLPPGMVTDAFSGSRCRKGCYSRQRYRSALLRTVDRCCPCTSSTCL